jgi:hypothetical protein
MKKGGKKTMSLKQIEANRQNSLKSSGPKTPAGKTRSRMNAMKHGILSDEVVVKGLRYKESSREFWDIRESYWQHFAPEGPLEEALLEQIVANRWRQRRVLIAETGEIALGVESGWWRRNNKQVTVLGCLAWMNSMDVVERICESLDGIRYLMSILEDVREDVKKEGELTEAALKRAQDSLGGKPNTLTNPLAQLRARLAENPEGLEAGDLKARHRQSVLEFVQRELSFLQRAEYRMDEHEEQKEEALQAASVLPSADTLDKLVRYETTLDRQFFRLMHQLERLQRMRKGENVPPPLTMEVSQRC